MRLFSCIALSLVVAGLVMPAALRAAPGSLKIGDKPEDFTLTAPDGKQHSLYVKEAPKATAIFFLSTRCPISNRYNARMVGFAQEYGPKGVRFLGVNSNEPESMEDIDEHAKRYSITFPVVRDANNVLADKWGAQITPEVFLFDQKGLLQYHGRIDDQLAEVKVKSPDLKNALDAMLAGKKVETTETKPHGCDIKRKP